MSHITEFSAPGEKIYSLNKICMSAVTSKKFPNLFNVNCWGERDGGFI